jgi:hypothetical protein
MGNPVLVPRSAHDESARSRFSRKGTIMLGHQELKAGLEARAIVFASYGVKMAILSPINRDVRTDYLGP